MAKAIPSFTYDGEYRTYADDTHWYIFLLTSGRLRMGMQKSALDIILIGGGGSGQNGNSTKRQGGGSGYNVQKTGFALAGATDYDVVIGAGGAQGSEADGEATLAFGLTAGGGQSGENGGAGTATGGNSTVYGSSAGGDGFVLFNNDVLGYVCGAGGGGQDSTNSVSAKSGGKGGGGRGGYAGQAGVDGAANMGAGGGAGGYSGARGNGGAGGSGLVVIRGSEKDALPVVFDGVQPESIVFNGTTIEHMVVNGINIY